MGSVSDFIRKQRKDNPNLRIGSLHSISEAQKYPPLPSGIPALDFVTSIGGIPRGMVTEFRGVTGSGKTTAAAQIAAYHQKAVRRGEAKGAILYLDFEFAVDEVYFAKLGLDVNDEETFVYCQPDTLEEGFNLFLEMTKAGLLAIGIVDSVAGASAQQEYDATIGKASVGLKARVLNQSFRMCIGPMRTSGTALLLINHRQEKIKTGWNPNPQAEYVSPGGVGVEFYPAMRIEFSKPSFKKSTENNRLTNSDEVMITSSDVVVHCFKNKTGMPHREAKLRVNFGTGFSNVYSALHILVDHNIVKKKTGGHYVFPEGSGPADPDFKIPQGEDKLLDAIEADEEWAARLMTLAQNLVLLQQQEQTSYDIVVDEGDLLEIIDTETGEVLQ